MKKYLIILAMLIAQVSAFACDACKKQQPKFLQDITHGRGPEGWWDHLIVTVMVIVTLYILVATVKCFVRPQEAGNEHIKRMVLKIEP